jgi:hypothetical protein
VGALVGMVIVGVRLRQQNLSAVLVDDLKATAVFLLLLGVICAPPLLLSTSTGVAAAWLTLGTGALVLVPLALVVVQRVRARRAG